MDLLLGRFYLGCSLLKIYVSCHRSKTTRKFKKYGFSPVISAWFSVMTLLVCLGYVPNLEPIMVAKSFVFPDWLSQTHMTITVAGKWRHPTANNYTKKGGLMVPAIFLYLVNYKTDDFPALTTTRNSKFRGYLSGIFIVRGGKEYLTWWISTCPAIYSLNIP